MQVLRVKYYLRTSILEFCNHSSENIESSVCLILLVFSCDDPANVLFGAFCSVFFFFFLVFLVLFALFQLMFG